MDSGNIEEQLERLNDKVEALDSSLSGVKDLLREILETLSEGNNLSKKQYSVLDSVNSELSSIEINTRG